MGYLFVDESGDPGLSVIGAGGASELLVFGSVFFTSWGHYEQWKTKHREWDHLTVRDRRGPKREFKFGDDRDIGRISFIRAARTIQGWGWCGTVVHKQDLFGWRGAEDWYRTLFGYHLNIVTYNHAYDHNVDRPYGTRVRIDQRSMSRDRRRLLEDEVLNRPRNAGILRPPKWVNGVFEDPRFLDSSRSAGIQLADYVAGACRMAYRANNRVDTWLNQLGNHAGYCQVWPPHRR